eukprot:s3596_g2.t1
MGSGFTHQEERGSGRKAVERQTLFSRRSLCRSGNGGTRIGLSRFGRIHPPAGQQRGSLHQGGVSQNDARSHQSKSTLEALTMREPRYTVAYGRAYSEFAKVVNSGGFKRRVTSFRVAHLALRDIPTCFITCQSSFCETGVILLPRLQKMSCIFRGTRNTCEVSMFILPGRRSALDVSCCVFSANRIVRSASSGHNMQSAWQARDIVSM